MRAPGRWFNQPVTVSTYLGETAYGPSWAGQVTVTGQVQAGRALVRTAGGDEVVAEVTLRFPPLLRVGAGWQPAGDVVTPESRVAVEGRDATILGVKPFRDRAGRIVYWEASTT